MGFHDASTSARLQQAYADLGNNETVESFLKSAGTLDSGEMGVVIAQARLLLKEFYAHLPLKRNRHAVNPLLALEWLQRRVDEGMNEESFHREMIEIFKGLRDAHTNYVLPTAYRKSVAFLPFLLEEYFTKNSAQAQRHFLVTRMLGSYTHPTFKPGVRITHWNGTPIERAVLLNADREEGSNEAARFAFGLAAMTVRSLDSSLPPDEGQVMIRYRAATGSASHEILFPWRVWQPPADDGAASGSGSALALSFSPDEPEAQLSECGRVVSTHQARKRLFASGVVQHEDLFRASTTCKLAMVAQSKAAPGRSVDLVAPMLADPGLEAANLSTQSTIPDALQFKRVGPGERYGYIRIRHFAHPNTAQFVNEFIRIVELLPKHGLIIDVRGNGGGKVPNGELILQTLTPKTIEPAPFEFISSDLTRKLCSVPNDAVGWLKDFRAELHDKWAESLKVAAETGAQFSNQVPLTDPEAARAIGQRYHGPVTLITDAQCYSTTDIFAAGFQDHAIGTIIGVADNTGAGGANVWRHTPDLRAFLPDEGTGLEELPKGISMRVSIRRTLRVGPKAGHPLEDLGVEPDVRYRMQRDDLLDGNRKLINFAIGVLKKGKRRQLDAVIENVNAEDFSLALTTQGLDQVEVRVDGQCRGSFGVTPGPNQIDVLAALHSESQVELRAYQAGELCAGRILRSEGLHAGGGVEMGSFDTEAVLEAITIELHKRPGKSYARLAEEACPEGWSYARVHRTRPDGYDLFPPEELDAPAAWEWVHALRLDERVAFAEPLFAALRIADIVGEAAESPSPLEASQAAADQGGWIGSDKESDWSLKLTQTREAWALPVPPGGQAQGAGIRVAHPDSGYSNHPELVGPRLLKDESWDFVTDADGVPDAIDEDGFHGTGTASVIMSGIEKPTGLSGQATVVGVAPQANLVPMRVAQQGFLRHAAILKREGMLSLRSAIYKAADAKCHVISISLGWIFSSGIEAAIRYAWDKDLIICAAAGNYTGRVVAWPGASSRTICLAGCTSRRHKWGFSTRGPAVDFTGPAKNVWRADYKGDKARVAPGSGTSHATATTAGIAALWLAYHGRNKLIARYRPHGVRLNEVFRWVLARSCDAPPKDHRRMFGLGTVNAKRALEAALPHPDEVSSPDGPFGASGIAGDSGPTSLAGMLMRLGVPQHDGQALLAARLGVDAAQLPALCDGKADELAFALFNETDGLAWLADNAVALGASASLGASTKAAAADRPALRLSSSLNATLNDTASAAE